MYAIPVVTVEVFNGRGGINDLECLHPFRVQA